MLPRFMILKQNWLRGGGLNREGGLIERGAYGGSL